MYASTIFKRLWAGGWGAHGTGHQPHLEWVTRRGKHLLLGFALAQFDLETQIRSGSGGPATPVFKDTSRDNIYIYIYIYRQQRQNKYIYIY